MRWRPGEAERIFQRLSPCLLEKLSLVLTHDLVQNYVTGEVLHGVIVHVQTVGGLVHHSPKVSLRHLLIQRSERLQAWLCCDAAGRVIAARARAALTASVGRPGDLGDGTPADGLSGGRGVLFLMVVVVAFRRLHALQRIPVVFVSVGAVRAREAV